MEKARIQQEESQSKLTETEKRELLQIQQIKMFLNIILQQPNLGEILFQSKKKLLIS